MSSSRFHVADLLVGTLGLCSLGMVVCSLKLRRILNTR